MHGRQKASRCFLVGHRGCSHRIKNKERESERERERKDKVTRHYAEDVIQKRTTGEVVEKDNFRARKIVEVQRSTSRLKKPEVPCLPFKQYVALHGNPRSKENKKKGHKVGFACGVKLVFLHDQVKKDTPWMLAPEVSESIEKIKDIDVGDDAEDSDEMEDKYTELVEKREKVEAKTLGNPFLLAVGRVQKAAVEKGSKKALKKTDSNGSESSSVSAAAVLKRHLKRSSKEDAGNSPRTPKPSSKGTASASSPNEGKEDNGANQLGRTPLAQTVETSAEEAYRKFQDPSCESQVFNKDVILAFQRCLVRWSGALSVKSTAAASEAQRQKFDVLRKKVQYMESSLKMSHKFTAGGPSRAIDFVKSWETNMDFCTAGATPVQAIMPPHMHKLHVEALVEACPTSKKLATTLSDQKKFNMGDATFKSYVSDHVDQSYFSILDNTPKSEDSNNVNNNCHTFKQITRRITNAEHTNVNARISSLS